MLGDISWTTIIVSLCGSVGTGIVILMGQVAKDNYQKGDVNRRVSDHDTRLKDANGKLAEQSRADSKIEERLGKIETRCDGRAERCVQNDRDHADLFARVVSLEKGQAARAGQMAEMMDKQFEKWRRYLKEDIRKTINEIDAEKMKFHRRVKNGTNHEDDWG